MSNVERQDSLIEEVRERRRSLFERHNNDLRELFKSIKELQEKHPEKIKKPQRR